MKRIPFVWFCSSLMIGLLPIAPCRADFLSLSGTGVDSHNNLLAGGSQDPHFKVSGPGTANAFIPAVEYSAANVYAGPAGPWVPDDPHSGWIGWVDQASPGHYGTYDYRTTFSLAGYNPLTAVLTGNWAADQTGSILLNGHATGQSLLDQNWNGSLFPNLNPLAISSGFVNGINTIDFIVLMPDGGDGLRVRNLQVSATPSVPEPTSLAMLGMGTVGLLGYCCRRRLAGASAI